MDYRKLPRPNMPLEAEKAGAFVLIDIDQGLTLGSASAQIELFSDDP